MRRKVSYCYSFVDEYKKLYRIHRAEELSRGDIDGFFREMLLYKLEIGHTLKSAHVLTKQLKEYSMLEQRIENQIKSTKDSIVRLQISLEQEQKIRKHRLECEEIAETVDSFPSRSTLKRKISQIESRVSTTQSLLKAVESEIQLKKAQFDQLLQTIDDLKRQGSIEEEKDKAAAESTTENTEEEEESNDRSNRTSRCQVESVSENAVLKPENEVEDEERDLSGEDSAVPEVIMTEDPDEANSRNEANIAVEQPEPVNEAAVAGEAEKPMDVEAGEEME